jgi:hypothetical protein
MLGVMETTKVPVPALTTVAQIKATIRRMDAIIAAGEPRAPQSDRAAWSSFMALKQKRHSLHLLLIARRVECRKQIVSLERWRHGFDVPEPEQSPPTTTRASR